MFRKWTTGKWENLIVGTLKSEPACIKKHHPGNPLLQVRGRPGLPASQDAYIT